MNDPTQTSQMTSTGWVPAKTIEIMKSPLEKTKPLDDEDMWSGDNGVDGFGHVEDDAELNKVRSRVGECVENESYCPRLILYRATRTSPLMAEFWLTRTFYDDDDPMLIMASLVRTVSELPLVTLNALSIDLIDWDANRPEAERRPSERYELSITLTGPASDFRALRAKWRQFARRFESVEWR